MNTDPVNEAASLTSALQQRVQAAIRAAGGWLPFDRFMALALYQPGLGYYANSSRKFGSMPGSGSDFVTAPELSPLFGRALAAQVAQALAAGGWDAVMEFGAGSGALAESLLDALGDAITDYAIVDLSGVLRQHRRAHQQRGDGEHRGRAADHRAGLPVPGAQLPDRRAAGRQRPAADQRGVRPCAGR